MSEPARRAAALALAGVDKRFGAVQALAGVSFELRAGEVHALVGENGAGKSTLLRILGGAHRPDAGAVLIDGQPVELASPRAARAHGIAVIYQEGSLVPWLSVAHNLLLGRERRAGWPLISRRRLHALAREALARLGVRLDPRTPVAHLGVAEQQMVEIAKALAEDARVILMDEPTASLTNREIGVLFAKIAALREAGVGIAYISHRLDEIARIADRVTVLRDGRVVGTWPRDALSLPDLITAMVGRPLGAPLVAGDAGVGDEVLRVDPPPAAAGGLPLTVRAGEIVGLAGLVGSGRTALAWRVFGAAPSVGERVHFLGREVRVPSPARARALGIGMVPEDRKAHGLVLDRSVRDNVTLTLLDRLAGRCGLLDRRRQAAVSQRAVTRLSIRCAGDRARVATLSGGNQQKVVLGKWLARQGRLLVLDEPTRGIDVGARFELHRLIRELARGGQAILLISSDLPELLALSDRLYVMREGALVAELDPRRTSQEEVLRHASGAGECSA